MNIEVVILGARRDRISRMVHEHGNVYDYDMHQDLPRHPLAFRVVCRCPGGHGAARLPLRMWVTVEEARLDLRRAEPVVEEPIRAA